MGPVTHSTGLLSLYLCNSSSCGSNSEEKVPPNNAGAPACFRSISNGHSSFHLKLRPFLSATILSYSLLLLYLSTMLLVYFRIQYDCQQQPQNNVLSKMLMAGCAQIQDVERSAIDISKHFPWPLAHDSPVLIQGRLALLAGID